MEIKLAEYQTQAVNELSVLTTTFMLENYGGDNTITFKSVTGSGKTVMLSAYISETFKRYRDVCFLWFSPGDGDLVRQSYESVTRMIGNEVNCSLLDYDTQATHLVGGDVLFVNWEKVTKKNNRFNTSSDGRNFMDMMNRTSEMGTRIVVLVDEVHFKGDSASAMSIIEGICADVNLFVSATPREVSSVPVVVDTKDVIEEGFIKSGIVINSGIDANTINFEGDDTDDFNLLMTRAFDKRNELREVYKREGHKVNPLVLIQIRNGEEVSAMYKERVIRFLTDRGVSMDEIGWHFDADSVNFSDIQENDRVSFLMFKQAIATGWDCPRSHILVRFREVSVESFNIQTLGRIMRVVNPEARRNKAKDEHKYKDVRLRTAYLYTNSLKLINDVKSTNIDYIVENVTLKDRVDNFVLESQVYKTRNKIKVPEKEFLAEFYKVMLTKYGISDLSISREYVVKMLEAKGFDTSFEITSVLLVETSIGMDFDQIELEGVDGGVYAKVLKNKTDVLDEYEYTLQRLMRVFKGVEKDVAIRLVERSLISLLDISEDEFDMMYAFVISNMQKLLDVYDETMQNISNYDGMVKDIVSSEFRLKQTLTYSLNTYTLADTMTYSSDLMSSYAYDRLYISNNVSNPERLFLANLSTNILTKRKVDIWWKNLDYGKNGFSIRYSVKDSETGKSYDSLTYPDFIVKFYDGTIGIFEIKSKEEFYHRKKITVATKRKADAICAYVKKMNAEGKKVVGGIVAEHNDILKIFLDSSHSGLPLNEYILGNVKDVDEIVDPALFIQELDRVSASIVGALTELKRPVTLMELHAYMVSKKRYAKGKDKIEELSSEVDRLVMDDLVKTYQGNDQFQYYVGELTSTSRSMGIEAYSARELVDWVESTMLRELTFSDLVGYMKQVELDKLFVNPKAFEDTVREYVNSEHYTYKYRLLIEAVVSYLKVNGGSVNEDDVLVDLREAGLITEGLYEALRDTRLVYLYLKRATGLKLTRDTLADKRVVYKLK